MGSTTAQLKTLRDFEIIWQDGCSNNPTDMDNVTLSIYHYEQEVAGSTTATIPEPYVITQGVNDTLVIGTVCPSSGFFSEEVITLDLGIIGQDVYSLGCPPNNFTVPLGGVCDATTTSKVCIVNGYNVYALSSCELASLINISSTGFTASSEDGFLVLTSKKTGSSCALRIGEGSLNSVLGLTSNEEFYGSDLERVFDLRDKPMQWVSTGTYVLAGESLESPHYVEGERYYALYKGYEPITGKPYFQQEDFTITKENKGCGLAISFTE